MVKIGLQIKAALENITGLCPENLPDFRWHLKLKCTQCGEITEHWQYVVLNENLPLKGGRGHANYVSKCKLCSHQNSLDIKPESLHNYNIQDSNKFKTVAVFDCRGLEPVEFEPRNGWMAKGYKPSNEEEEEEGSETGTVFNEIDLSDKEWADYDEKSNLSTVITEWACDFVTIKE